MFSAGAWTNSHYTESTDLSTSPRVRALNRSLRMTWVLREKFTRALNEAAEQYLIRKLMELGAGRDDLSQAVSVSLEQSYT
jgi:hypothetical protein